MIITIEAIEGNSGQGQPVFSRTGITTVFQENPMENGGDEDEEVIRERKRKKKQQNQQLTAVSTLSW